MSLAEREPILCVQGLTKSYREGERTLQVLSGLDLEIHRGERVALLGQSGSGKSTLLNLLAGIDRADAGDIRILGTGFGALDERGRTVFRRRHIGFIYQSFNLIPTLSALENVALPLELNGMSATDADRRAGKLLHDVGLGTRAGAYPDNLSGGEQQRVAIARALVHRPALVLADEPTGNLDAGNGRHVLELLTSLCADHGSGLLLVTHSLSVAGNADRTLALADGRLRADDGELAW